ncbi:MAG: response regulator transcription factor [Dehalococcoidia bacterium]
MTSETTDGRIRVMIVDDHTVVRDGIASLLEADEAFEVAGHASDGVEAVERAPAIKPDVVLMDLRMPRMDGVEAMRRLREASPDLRFIVLTTFDTDEYIFEAIEAGARGFLLKDSSRDDLFRAIRAVHQGDSLIEPSVAARVLDRMARMTRGESTGPTLSERELEVLRLIALGRANKEIAAELTLSESTVKTYVARVFDKLDASGRTEAVTKALQLGLINL